MPDTLSQTLKKLLNRRIGVLLLLGFASGLPLELTGGTLQLWLADEGVDPTALQLGALLPFLPDAARIPGFARVVGLDLTTIALFTLVGLPYILKVFWSPLMDRFVPPFLGRRRGWMLVTQVALIGGLCGMALTSPMKGPLALAVFALFVAFASASQDVVIDAYSTDVLHEEERGFGAAVKVMGYRFAMLVAGGVAAIIGDVAGWPAAYLSMAGFMSVGVVATLLAPRPEITVAPPRTLATAVVEPLRELFSRRAALWVILAVVLYKFGDAFAGSL